MTIVSSHLRKLGLGVAIVAIATVVLTVGASAHPANSQTIKAGGTLNVGWENNFADMSDSFDPTGEYLGDAWGILSGLMVRNLVSYQHVAGPAGNVIVPDIATSVPKPTNGGKTYTFHLKTDIKFSPPVNRAVTSADFVTALDRLANPKDGGEYAFYFNVIKGWDAYAKGKASHISGISTPNKSTIIFNLTQPAGDFLYRLTLPAASPMPAEVMKCFQGKPGAYGRDIVSTAGYMFKGEDQVNISSCAAIKPASGFDGLSMMDLVRNPNAAPDAYRHNYADEVRFLTDANSTDIYNKIEAGTLDTAISSIPAQVGAKYNTDPSLKQYLHINAGDRIWYLTMNLTQPPFDDVHVRKAMNWIIDKAALQQAWGGAYLGPIANHMIPDSVFSNQLADYKPYGTAGDHGSVSKALAAMKGSKYANSSGMCTAAACKNVLMVADVRSVDPKMVAVIQQDAAKIGITFTVRSTSAAYPTIQTPVEERSVRRAARLGQGLCGRAHVLRSALRRQEHHPAGQHELLARRDHAGAVQDAEDHRQLHQRAERQLGPRPLRHPHGPGAPLVLREPGQEADHADRSVDPVAPGQLGAHHELQRDALAVRPVPGRSRVREPGSQVVTA